MPKRSEIRRAYVQNGQEDTIMKGYYTTSGFYGLVDGVYVLFASETDYYETMADAEDSAA